MNVVWSSVDGLTVLDLFVLGLGGVITARLAIREPTRPLPLALATVTAGVTCFGGAGVLALRLFTFSPVQSLLAALIFAIPSAILFLVLATITRRSTERRQMCADLIGALALVSTPIAPGRAGWITTNGTRPTHSLAAISRDSLAIPTGTTVVITALHHGPGGDAAEVVPLSETPGPVTDPAG